MPLLTTADLAPFATIEPAKADAMVASAVAMAATVAPCVVGDDFTDPNKLEAVKSILRDAVLRWNDAGSGAAQTQTAGPFSQTLDTRQQRRGMFWPSEIEQLQGLCRSGSSGAFSVDPGSSAPSVSHASVCPALSGGVCLCDALTASSFGIPTSEAGCSDGWY